MFKIIIQPNLRRCTTYQFINYIITYLHFLSPNFVLTLILVLYPLVYLFIQTIKLVVISITYSPS